jgi:hypothetical protein
MISAIKYARQGQYLLQGEFDRTRRVWKDAAAQSFRNRFYDPAIDLFERYCATAEELSEAMQDAEAEVSRR